MTEPFADEAAVRAAMGLQQQRFDLPGVPPVPDPPEEPEEKPEDEFKEDIPEFDPKWKQAFTGLLYVGALTEVFEVYGHSFTIATPTLTEHLQIGQVIEPYQSTVMAEIAFQTARVAAYLVSIDGKELPRPITNDPKENSLQQRFQWVTDTLKRPVINKISDRCYEMDAKVEGVLEAMGKA
jgi:hypothetical protein